MRKPEHQVADIVESLTMRAVLALLGAIGSWQSTQAETCPGWIPACQESAAAVGVSGLGWVALGLSLTYAIRAGQLQLRYWKHRRGS